MFFSGFICYDGLCADMAAKCNLIFYMYIVIVHVDK